MKLTLEGNGKKLVFSSDKGLSSQEVFDAYQLFANSSGKGSAYQETMPATPEDTEPSWFSHPVYVKVKVECPTCNYEGETTTRRGNKYCKCPNCEVKLFNAFATGTPEETDAEGYEFHATSEYITKNWGG